MTFPDDEYLASTKLKQAQCHGCFSSGLSLKRGVAHVMDVANFCDTATLHKLMLTM